MPSLFTDLGVFRFQLFSLSVMQFVSDKINPILIRLHEPPSCQEATHLFIILGRLKLDMCKITAIKEIWQALYYAALKRTGLK